MIHAHSPTPNAPFLDPLYTLSFYVLCLSVFYKAVATKFGELYEITMDNIYTNLYMITITLEINLI